MKKNKTEEKKRIPPKSHQEQRLRLISDLVIQNKVKDNPRNYVVITQARQILDVSGVYEIQVQLPDPLEEGNHVWVRGNTSDGKEIVASAIVMEDHIKRETTEGVQDCVMICDEPKTKEWIVPRNDLSALPLTYTAMLIHKKNLDKYLGDGWSQVFWNHKLGKRRVNPKSRIIRGNEIERGVKVDL